MNFIHVAVFLCASCVGLSAGHFHYETSLGRLEVFLNGRKIFEHSADRPAFKVGVGNAEYIGLRGNFKLVENLTREVELSRFSIEETAEAETGNAESNGSTATPDGKLIVHFKSQDGAEEVSVEMGECSSEGGECDTRRASLQGLHYIRVIGSSHPLFNRLWMRVFAEKEERVYGGGEQFSHFQLRGRAYPMWVREQGVGRNHSTFITKMADMMANAGGDYHTTYWPQATFTSDRLYYLHMDYDYYSVLNFSSSDRHEIEMWEDFTSCRIYIETSTSWYGLLERMTSFLGRQPPPPAWLNGGAVLGLQGGTEKVLERYDAIKAQGVEVSAIWIQDWSGNYFTDLGSRVYWNWRWNKDFYPQLDQVIKRFDEEEGVKFLAYINPHVLVGSEMFDEADEKGFLIKSKKTGKSLIIDFEMDCGTVDLTNPAAYEWYKDVLKEMLALGLGGWMADFGGEYLVVDDAVYHSGESPRKIHNRFSELWARLNREAVEEMGVLEDTFLFFRSGFGRASGYATVAWAGDQNVDFSWADGLASTIPAALSLGMSGMGMSHSDIGGYVSAMCMVRTQELFLRWAEMAVFTPIMRTHEGNRPNINWQLYTTNSTMRQFARLTRIYRHLAPYRSLVALQNARRGIPAQRPLLLLDVDDPCARDLAHQYMLGDDLLVAPVLLEGAARWRVYLPAGEWRYLWNGSEVSVVPPHGAGCRGREVEVDVAAFGFTPVFYRSDSRWRELFAEISREYGPKEGVMKREHESLSFTLLSQNPMLFFYLLLRYIFWYLFFNV